MAEPPRDRRPGPPALPRCQDCDVNLGAVSYGRARHADDCQTHQRAQAHWRNVRAVETALAAAVAAKRQDRAFMERLADRLERDTRILERLADAPPNSKRPPRLPTEERYRRRPWVPLLGWRTKEAE